MRRPLEGCALALASAILLLAVTAQGAEAHGGRLELKATAGPYAILAYATRAGSRIDETLTLTDAASGILVNGGSVALTLTRGDESRGPYVARVSAGVAEAFYPSPDGDGWTVSIAVQGPRGTATASHPYAAPLSAAAEWGQTGGVLGAVALVAAAAYFLGKRRQQRQLARPRTSPDG